MDAGTVAHQRGVWLRARRIAVIWQWALAATLLAVVGLASAQTRVGGVIAADARWTAAASPYLLQSDLIIQNGATLEIEAGTDIYVAAGVAAHVQSGTLKAIGRKDARIRVLSAKTRDGTGAAPGDYKAWSFYAGARDVALAYVLFQHGSGLAVRGSSVQLDHVEIIENAGAAISTDLAASLSGAGNAARGNGTNGVLIPAGDVATTVTWGLRGIPYVVESGTVSVGQSPTLDVVAPSTLQAGETATLQVTGRRLDGLAGASSSHAGVSIEILPGATATSASLQVTAAVEAEPGPAVLSLLTDAGIAAGPATLRILAPQPTITALEPARVFVGQGVVALDVVGRGFVTDTTVQLNGTALATTRVDATRLRVSVPNQSALANLAVRLRSPDPANAGQFVLSNEVALPVQAAQIRITPAPAEVIRGTRTEFTVALPYAPPGGDATVTLVSSVPGVASVPASVVVPADETSATFELTAVATGNTVITASRSGMVSGQSTVTVVPPPSLRLSPQELLLGAGRSAELELVASKAAPAGGLQVQLRSSAADVASVPDSVVLAEGATTLKVPVSSHALGLAVITASAQSHVDGQATISVRPVSLNLPSATVVAPGLTRAIPLTLSDPAPAGGLTVQLRSSNAAIATVPATLQVAAGETNASFVLTGVSAGSVRIDATADGYEAAQVAASIESISINLGNPVVSSISMPMLETMTYPVRLSRPAPAGGVVIDLSVENSDLATVQPRQVTIAEGETASGTMVSVKGLAMGNTRLLANSAGLSAASIPMVLQQQAQLQFSRRDTVVGRGTRDYQYNVYVYRTVDGGNYYAERAVQVRLRSSDPSKVSVPETVTIPAGSYHAYFQVEGVELTGSTPVEIQASFDGYLSPTTPFSVTTVAPEFQLSSMDSKRSPASARDDVYIQLYVPGAPNPWNAVAARDLRIDLSVVDASDAGIVTAFHPASTGAEEITSVTLRAGASSGDWFHIGTPTRTGSYAVRASSTGIGSWTSGAVTVSAPELRFSRTEMVVGKGTRNYQYEIQIQRFVDGAIFNGADALPVTLTSSDGKALPQDVVIPAGQSSAYFYVTGVDITGASPSIIDASAPGYAAPPTKLPVRVVAPTLVLNSLDGRRSPASARDDFYLSLYVEGSVYAYNASAATDLRIDLSAVDSTPDGIIESFHDVPNGGTPITSVVLPAGSNSTNWLYVGTPTAAGSYRVRAAIADVGEVTSGTVTVTAPQLTFSRSDVIHVGKGFTTYPYEVHVQRMVDGVVFAGVEPLTVTLTSSDPTRAVATQVVIPAGQNGVMMPISGIDLTDGTPVELVASAPGYASSATPLRVNVVAPVFQMHGLDGVRTPASGRDDFYLGVYVPNASYSGNQTATSPLRVALSVIDAQPAGNVSSFHDASTGGAVIDSVTFAQGQTYTGYAYVETPRAGGSYKVRAAAAGIAQTDSGVVRVIPPSLRFNRSVVVAGKGMETYEYEIHVERVAEGSAFIGAEPLVVNLKCSAAAICSVPQTVTIPANSSGQRFRVKGTGVGSTTISASAVGHDAAPEVAVNVVLPRPMMQISNNFRAGQGYDFYVHMYVPGSDYAYNHVAAAPMTVNITSSAPGVATVTPTVELAAGQSSSPYIRFNAVAPGTTTLTGSGTDLESTTTTPITVIP